MPITSSSLHMISLHILDNFTIQIVFNFFEKCGIKDCERPEKKETCTMPDCEQRSWLKKCKNLSLGVQNQFGNINFTLLFSLSLNCHVIISNESETD